MVLTPSSHHLNIFTTTESMVINEPTNYLKIRKTDIKNISDPNLSVLVEADHDEEKDEKVRKKSRSSSNLGRNRYFSTTSLSSMYNNNNETSEFRKKRHFSTDSLSVCLEDNNNLLSSSSNPMASSISTSKSLNSLQSINMDKLIKRAPPHVAPKPLKRRLSELFSLKVNDHTATPVITVEDTSEGELNAGQQHTQQLEMPKQRTPNLFRKFGKSVPSILEMTSKESALPERMTKDDSLLSGLKQQNGSGELKKSRSFSLKTDESNSNALKLPGVKSFSSFRRSPFSKTKFDHNNSSSDVKKKAYDEMLKCVRDNDCKRLKLLIKRRKADVNTLEHNPSLLHEASYKGCAKCTKALLKMGWSVNLPDSLEWKPLHVAVFGGCLETVRVLLHHGACVNDVTSDGFTPLHLAVHLGDLYIVHELITHGSNPLMSTTNFPETPFQLSINLKKTLILDYFLYQSCFLVDKA